MSSTKSNVANPTFPPEEAWRLWNQLSDLTSRLWDIYEVPFLDFCIADTEATSSEKRPDKSALPF